MRTSAFCLLFLLLQIAECIGLWWYEFPPRAVGRALVFDERKICRRAKRLGGLQEAMCRRSKSLVHEIMMGARLGVMECEHQLRFHRWNCTTERRSIGKMLVRDTRETAFVQGITAAAAAFHLVELCNRGNYSECSCIAGDPLSGKFSSRIYFSEGCVNPVEFGMEKSAEFMDLSASAHSARKKDLRDTIMHHNNLVGRQAIQEDVIQKCKCHGLSGSCEIKTCFKKLSNFRVTAMRLHEKFRVAKEVQPGNDGRSWRSVEGRGGTAGGGIYRRSLPLQELIYTEPSPDFCKRTLRLGVLGPKGRECRISSGSDNRISSQEPEEGVGSCEHLCCNRGHRIYTETTEKSCRCKFKWCCKVTCETCVEQKLRGVCN